MRPVNLIPPEARRGPRRPLRAGPLSYLVVGVLLAGLTGVTALVLTGNEIAASEADVARLDDELTALEAEAARLKPYTEFRTMEEARTETVTSLAKSRFDWERVLRELSLVLPKRVWLINVTGTVSPDVDIDGAAEVLGRDEVEGPALELVGCGATHDAVATFVAALEDIDGVTRVTVTKSEIDESTNSTDDTNTSTDSSASSGGDDDCRVFEGITRFEIVAAFDEVELEQVEPPAPPDSAPDAQPTTETASAGP